METIHITETDIIIELRLCASSGIKRGFDQNV